jgi:thiamin-phosphate kinase
MRLPHGKIPIDILREVVFTNLGAKRKEVAVGPSAGIDAAVIDTENRSLIVSMDPITGALETIGWLAVNVNANDVATFGVEPAFLVTCLLLPEDSQRKTIETICNQMNDAAKELNIAIVGGHCEITPGIANPIVVGCIIGTTEKGNYVTAAGAKPGDMIILTKSAGIEGTAILASDREEKLKKTMNIKMIQKAKEFYTQISVVKEAITAFKTGGVDAMHDPTEGGIIGGINEMADASNLGVRIHEEKIPVQHETEKICKLFKINPLYLISSGALLIAAKPEAADKIVAQLKNKGIHATIIGQFLKNPKERFLVNKSGEQRDLPRPSSDHLWLALKQE